MVQTRSAESTIGGHETPRTECSGSAAPNDIVEQVARAICKDACQGQFEGEDLVHYVGSNWQHYVSSAQAALTIRASSPWKFGPAHPHNEPAETKSAIGLIEAERRRQIEEEGWTEEHDDEHKYGELLQVAMSYMANALEVASFEETEYGPLPFGWPWDSGWWKPTTPERDLIKAGALLLAERDRLLRYNRNHDHVDRKLGIAIQYLARLSKTASVCGTSSLYESCLNQSEPTP